MGGAGVGCGGGGGGANRGDGSGWVRGGCDSHSSSSSSEDDWGEEAVAVGECAHRGMRRSMWALLGVVRRRLGLLLQSNLGVSLGRSMAYLWCSSLHHLSAWWRWIYQASRHKKHKKTTYCPVANVPIWALSKT